MAFRKNGRGEEEVSKRGTSKNSGSDLLKMAVRLPRGDIWEVIGSDSGRGC